MKKRVAVLLMAVMFCFSSLNLSAASGELPEKAAEETSADQEEGEETPEFDQADGEEAEKADPAEDAAETTDGDEEETETDTDGTSEDLKSGKDGTELDEDGVAQETESENEETGQETDGTSEDAEPGEDLSIEPRWNEGKQVARIGDRKFDTMDDAMAAAKDGDVIAILVDTFDWETIECNLDEETPYRIDKNITIDGSEYLAATGERINLESNIWEGRTDYMFEIVGGSLTLKDIEIDGCHTSAASFVEARICEVTNGKLILQNCYLANFQKAKREPVHIGSGGTLEMDAESYCGISYFLGYYPDTTGRREYDYNYKHGVQLDADATLINHGGHIVEVFAEGGSKVSMEGGVVDRMYLEYDETNGGAELQLNSGEVADLAVSTTEKGINDRVFSPVKGTYKAGAEIPEQTIRYIPPAEPEARMTNLITGSISKEDQKMVDAMMKSEVSCGNIASDILKEILARDREALKETAQKALESKLGNVPAGDIYIHMIPYTQVQIKGVDAERNIITLDISIHYDLVAASTKDMNSLNDNNSVVFESGREFQPNNMITMTLGLPRSFASDYLTVKHTKNNGEVYYYSADVTDRDLNSDLVEARFQNMHGFSEFQFLLDERKAVIEYGFTSGTKRSVTYKPDNINATELLSDDKVGGTFEGWVYNGIDGVWKGLMTDELLTKLSERYAQTNAPIKATPKYASGGSSGNHSSGSHSSSGSSSGSSSSAGTPAPASAVQPIASAATGDDMDLGTPVLMLMLALAGLCGCWKMKKNI